ncbi:hypothetical protein CKO28_15410 [Rhodovibrio sodomensis]|uniref:Uncharacterized protein n=1 Tax=Rhodovibrio sodomensis TaxID=1088 RepID=A0ABS1DJ65_9PROT|nr:hypothetical protein [Rhodovibrio sodomensis]MBK1669425.1 hypothetical protein [Rhodovibrio sodomensis]
MIPEWLPTLLGAAGMAALFMPAYRANRIARRYSEVAWIAAGDTLPDSLKEPAKTTAEERRDQIGRWSKRDEALMWAGYTGLGLSYGLQLIRAI